VAAGASNAVDIAQTGCRLAQVPRSIRTRLADTVSEQLRERILSGQMRAGERLREETLAAQFNVSRTPLREALRKLEEQGLVDVSTQGVRIVEPDMQALLEAYELREFIDGLAARLVSSRTQPELRRTLYRALSVQHSALEPWNSRLWTEGNVLFHGAIAEAAHNRYVLQLVPVMRLTAQMFYPQMLLDRERAREAFNEHRDIAEAIQRRAPDEAERQARAHIRRTAELLRLRADEEAQRTPGVGNRMTYPERATTR